MVRVELQDHTGQHAIQPASRPASLLINRSVRRNATQRVPSLSVMNVNLSRLAFARSTWGLYATQHTHGTAGRHAHTHVFPVTRKANPLCARLPLAITQNTTHAQGFFALAAAVGSLLAALVPGRFMNAGQVRVRVVVVGLYIPAQTKPKMQKSEVLGVVHSRTQSKPSELTQCGMGVLDHGVWATMSQRCYCRTREFIATAPGTAADCCYHCSYCRCLTPDAATATAAATAPGAVQAGGPAHRLQRGHPNAAGERVGWRGGVGWQGGVDGGVAGGFDPRGYGGLVCPYGTHVVSARMRSHPLALGTPRAAQGYAAPVVMAVFGGVFIGIFLAFASRLA